MGFPADNSKRVSQGKYWALFGAYMVATVALLGGGVVAIVQGSIGLGLLMIVAIVPLGIYWRVIMMRRCRDIGWPAFLPWAIFGLQFVTSFLGQASFLGGTTPSLGLLMLPLLLGLADFVFSIVIGCMGSKREFDYNAVFDDYRGEYRDEPQRTRPASAAPAVAGAGGDRFDDAIARALEAHRRGESVLDARPAARPAPAMPARAPAGFGRKMA
jgi:uncharacterized membrane protein YhaH (DUF805 family)